MVLTPAAPHRSQNTRMVALAIELQNRLHGALSGILAELRASDGTLRAQTFDREVKSPNRGTSRPTESAAFRGPLQDHERRRARLGEIPAEVIALLSEGLDICDHYAAAALRCKGYDMDCTKVVPPERANGGLCTGCRHRKGRAERAASHDPGDPAQ